MRKSKIRYLFNIIIASFLIVNFVCFKPKSYYDSEKIITGIVLKKIVKDDKVSLVIKGKEKVKVSCYKCTFLGMIGDTIEFVGEFKDISGNTNFNLFNYKYYLYSEKIYKNFVFKSYEVKTKSNKIVYNTYNKIEERINKFKASSFTKAMILGDTSTFEDEIMENYKINGIVHLFAISGMHVGILATIILKILNKISKNLKLNYLLISLVLLFYMLLINSVSIKRSVVMFILCSVKKVFNLKISTLNILFYIFAFYFYENPYVIYNLGFKLSYLVSLGLIISSKKLKGKNYLNSLVITSTISFLVSMPIIINSNFEINLLSIFINVLIIPIVSIILFPLSIITFAFPIFDNVLNYLLNGFNILNRFLASNSIILNIPKLNYLEIIVYYLLLLLILKRRKHILLLVVLIIIFKLKPFFNINPYLTMIDVGQGDAILITYPFNKNNILIDVGGSANSFNNAISPYLKSIGIRRIDHLIISHGDADHIIGAYDLIKNFNVKNIYINSYSNSQFEEKLLTEFDVKIISEETKIDENIIIYNFPTNNENDDSLLTYFKDFKILLMGDASKNIESKLNIFDINILKVGHHGSKTSSDKEFIDKLKPKIALISVGLKNKYKHPNQIVLDNLKDSKTYLTSKSGMIKINLKNLQVQTCL